MKVMVNKSVLEEYEIKVVDRKANPKENIHQIFHRENRWMVKFGDNSIAINFLSEEAAREYLKVYEHLGLCICPVDLSFPCPVGRNPKS